MRINLAIHFLLIHRHRLINPKKDNPVWRFRGKNTYLRSVNKQWRDYEHQDADLHHSKDTAISCHTTGGKGMAVRIVLKMRGTWGHPLSCYYLNKSEWEPVSTSNNISSLLFCSQINSQSGVMWHSQKPEYLTQYFIPLGFSSKHRCHASRTKYLRGLLLWLRPVYPKCMSIHSA